MWLYQHLIGPYSSHTRRTLTGRPLRAFLHMMASSNETFSALPALYAGNSPVTGEFPAQRPVTWNFDVFFDLRLDKRLSKQSWGWWFETLSCTLWRHSNAYGQSLLHAISNTCLLPGLSEGYDDQFISYSLALCSNMLFIILMPRLGALWGLLLIISWN